MAIPQTSRLQALQNLAGQMPVASQRIATGQQAARNMQIQQAVQKAPATTQITSAAQQTGATVAQQAGEQAAKNVEQGAKQLGQVSQLGIAEQQRADQAATVSLQSGAREQQMDATQRLAKLDSRLAKEEITDKMQFQKDELGRTIFNETQLADYARSSAKSDEQFNTYRQKAEQLSKRKLQAMEQATKLIMADLEHKYQVAKSRGDYEATMEIDRVRGEAEHEMEKQRAKAANRTAIYSAIGGTIGAVVGGIYGGSGGAAAGGAGGSAAGKATAK